MIDFARNYDQKLRQKGKISKSNIRLQNQVMYHSQIRQTIRDPINRILIPCDWLTDVTATATSQEPHHAVQSLAVNKKTQLKLNN